MATDDINLGANDVAKIIANETNSGGGGNKFSAQVGIKNLKDFESFFENPKMILKKHMN